eukprot:5701903-Pleurochrysis_carterae.AAC.2
MRCSNARYSTFAEKYVHMCCRSSASSTLRQQISLRQFFLLLSCFPAHFRTTYKLQLILLFPPSIFSLSPSLNTYQCSSNILPRSKPTPSQWCHLPTPPLYSLMLNRRRGASCGIRVGGPRAGVCARGPRCRAALAGAPSPPPSHLRRKCRCTPRAG